MFPIAPVLLLPRFRHLVVPGVILLFASVFAGAAPVDRFSGSVDSVEVSAGPDVVFCSGGSASGFRPGMVLVVEQEGSPVAELIVIGTRRNETAALITRISVDRELRKGDLIRVKTRKPEIL